MLIDSAGAIFVGIGIKSKSLVKIAKAGNFYNSAQVSS
jgi:hypothetical protein